MSVRQFKSPSSQVTSTARGGKLLRPWRQQINSSGAITL